MYRCFSKISYRFCRVSFHSYSFSKGLFDSELLCLCLYNTPRKGHCLTMNHVSPTIHQEQVISYMLVIFHGTKKLTRAFSFVLLKHPFLQKYLLYVVTLMHAVSKENYFSSFISFCGYKSLETFCLQTYFVRRNVSQIHSAYLCIIVPELQSCIRRRVVAESGKISVCQICNLTQPLTQSF